MRFTIRLLFVLLLTISTRTIAHAEEPSSDTFSSLIAESYAAEKRIHRKLLRALGAQNLPMQAAIETPPTESSEFDVKLIKGSLEK